MAVFVAIAREAARREEAQEEQLFLLHVAAIIFPAWGSLAERGLGALPRAV